MKSLPKAAIVILIVSIAAIVVGCVLALNSGANPTRIENTLVVEPAKKYFPGLEIVNLKGETPEQLKKYTGFTVSFNKENHTPNYVAWELLAQEITDDAERSNRFWQDPEIEGCAAHSDYTHSGYDRGHMCPAADQKWSWEAMQDCFVMANMCPQDHSLNAGAWNTLENKERQWALRDSAIMIVAGPVYQPSDTKRIGDIGVRVPSAFFKAFLAPYLEEPRAIAFVYPNMSAPGNMQDYAMSIDDLEELLGFDLFAALPDEIENVVEANYSFKEWNRR
ncbi:MAG: DNA/RNA non-specific endonuclease [Muribaculaceae bacterium]|nr:DNA/RNA non-specific endonuclease [Muribaculaceae bacterium]